jgi:hypothetical protein
VEYLIVILFREGIFLLSSFLIFYAVCTKEAVDTARSRSSKVPLLPISGALRQLRILFRSTLAIDR